mgnify:CR=1 FL=1
MKKTAKLLGAATILAGERFADMDVDEFIERAKQHKVSFDQVYRAVHRLGYHWTGRYWQLNLPYWLEHIIDAQQDKTLKNVDPARKVMLKAVERIAR